MLKGRHPFLKFFLIGIGIFNVADYFLTLEVISQGHEEANPIIDAILPTIYFPIVKLVVVPLLLLFLWNLRQHFNRRCMLYVWTGFMVYFSLMIYFKVMFF